MILVTGASGHVGRAVLEALLAHPALPPDRALRALVRERPIHGLPARVECVRGDLSQPDSLVDALRGVRSVFLVTPPTGHAQVAAAAVRAGVTHAVLLSSIATQKVSPAQDNPIAARHRAAEQALLASGLHATLLRPDTFATNALEWAPSIQAEGRVRAPHGDSLRCPIHERDIADVAAQCLLNPGAPGEGHWLTGPALLSQREQVQAIATALGRPLRFEDEPPAQALERMATRLPRAAAERLLEYLQRSIDAPPALSDAVPRLTGRPGRDFARWARDHVAEFRVDR